MRKMILALLRYFFRAVSRLIDNIMGTSKYSSAMKRGDSLAQAGKFQEALEQYLWAYDHGRNTGFDPIRNSYLLGKILSLNPQYPQAMTAIEARRKIYSDNLMCGVGTTTDIVDVFIIDSNLGKPDETKHTIKTLEDKGLLTKEMQASIEYFSNTRKEREGWFLRMLSSINKNIRLLISALGGYSEVQRAIYAGRDFEDLGRTNEALNKYFWAFDHSRSKWTPERLNYLLGKIIYLGKKHPEAIEGLRIRRHIFAGNLLSGLGNERDVLDIGYIDWYLGKSNETDAFREEIERAGLMTDILNTGFEKINQIKSFYPRING